MPAKDEKELPAEITIQTKLTGNLKVTLLATDQKVSYKKSEHGIKIALPKNLISQLAKQEAVVIKISK